MVTGGILQTQGQSANHSSAGFFNENLLFIYKKLVNFAVGGTRSGNGDIPSEQTTHAGNVAKQPGVLCDNNVKLAPDEKGHYKWLLAE